MQLLMLISRTRQNNLRTLGVMVCNFRKCVLNWGMCLFFNEATLKKKYGSNASLRHTTKLNLLNLSTNTFRNNQRRCFLNYF